VCEPVVCVSSRVPPLARLEASTWLLRLLQAPVWRATLVFRATINGPLRPLRQHQCHTRLVSSADIDGGHIHFLVKARGRARQSTKALAIARTRKPCLLDHWQLPSARPWESHGRLGSCTMTKTGCRDLSRSATPNTSPWTLCGHCTT
jgi:hypothetical protein